MTETMFKINEMKFIAEGILMKEGKQSEFERKWNWRKLPLNIEQEIMPHFKQIQLKFEINNPYQNLKAIWLKFYLMTIVKQSHINLISSLMFLFNCTFLFKEKFSRHITFTYYKKLLNINIVILFFIIRITHKFKTYVSIVSIFNVV